MPSIISLQVDCFLFVIMLDCSARLDLLWLYSSSSFLNHNVSQQDSEILLSMYPGNTRC